MLKIAISSRALFHLEDGHQIFQEQGFAAFDTYMRENEQKPLRPGASFQLIRKLLALNSLAPEPVVSVCLLSANTLEAGARIMNSIEHYGLNIAKACFTSGGNRIQLAKAAGVDMLLSTNKATVMDALDHGIAAAVIMPDSRQAEHDTSSSVCIAFDGDAVIFSDACEAINQIEGFEAFVKNERTRASDPIPGGPFAPVLLALHQIQQNFIHLPKEQRPLRIALVTARGIPVYSRVLATFRQWGVDVDEAALLNGDEKGPYLAALNADIFLDDGMHNVMSAKQYVPTGHVPNGIQGRPSN